MRGHGPAAEGPPFRLWEPESPDDARAVALQLGRAPRGRWRVARRCACGLPQVIETHPVLEGGTPFPTMHWLTCPALASAVGRLEGGGWMAALNARLEANAALRVALAEAIARYLKRRDALAPLGREGHPGGGPERVKCLHAHTAQQLATGDNPVGAAVLAKLGWTDPEAPCVHL